MPSLLISELRKLESMVEVKKPGSIINPTKNNTLTDDELDQVERIEKVAIVLFGKSLAPTHAQLTVLKNCGFDVLPAMVVAGIWKSGKIITPYGNIVYSL